TIYRDAAINFFMQAEDGIRDRNVTGVQTCALPISSSISLCRSFDISNVVVGQTSGQFVYINSIRRAFFGISAKEYSSLNAVSMTTSSGNSALPGLMTFK